MSTFCLAFFALLAAAWGASSPLAVAAEPGELPSGACGEAAAMRMIALADGRRTDVLRGVNEFGQLVEVYGALDGTWLVLVTDPGGDACVMGRGRGLDLTAPAGPESVL